MKINGIVLAAGIGSRLAPLTEKIPKPVLPVRGEPLLLHVLQRLKDAGVERIAVNTHHLHEQVESCVKNSKFADDVELFYEKEILGTAGPLIPAKKLLTDCDCFVLHNGDILNNFDLQKMIREHMESGAVLTMAMIEGPENRVHVENGRVVDILDRRGIPYSKNGRKMTYAGISVFSPEFFQCLPETVQPYAFKDAWDTAFKKNLLIHAFLPDQDYFWNDIGSFSQYFEANRTLIAENTMVQGKNCKISPEAEFTGFNSVGSDCVIPAGAHLHNCILLDRAKVPAGYSAWTVFGPDFAYHRDEVDVRSLKIFEGKSDKITFKSLPEQGSSRRFYRISGLEPGKTAILMISNEKDKDFMRFVELGKIYFEQAMRTPEIYAYNASEFAVLMEDLGDDTLYNLCSGASAETVFRYYSMTVRALVDFQKYGESALAKDGLPMRSFSLPYLQWETDYFQENFLQELCGFQLTETEQRWLTRELRGISYAARKMPYLLLHRDFQSQNILVHNGTVRFVDFQGSRLGPYAYDIVSLLKDPYMNLPMEIRTKLAEQFRLELWSTGIHVSPEQFAFDYAIASLQRNMQALGAYGFLSLRMKKKKYLAYAEPCLNLLRESVEFVFGTQSDLELGFLREMCQRASEILPQRLQLFKNGK